MDKKLLKIVYDSEVGTTHVEVENVNDIDVCNALANVCSSVIKMLIRHGMSVELANRKLTAACAAGMVAGAKELGHEPELN